jgi:hypothetical protein
MDSDGRARGGPRLSAPLEVRMLDLVYVALVCVFFVASWGYVRACNKI